MNENNITELRNVLFDTIRQLKDQSNPIEIDRAKAINETAQTIINSAKVEVEYAKATGSTSATKFLSDSKQTNAGGYTHLVGQRGNR